MKKIVLGLMMVVLLCGCGPKPVEFYKTHDAERKAVLDKWASNPGKFSTDKDCINALAADAELARKKFIENMAKPGKRTVDTSITIK